MDQYWVPHDARVWLPCQIKSQSGDKVVFAADDGTSVTLKTTQLPGLEKVHGEQLNGVDDICKLSVVSEAAMLNTVRMRYLLERSKKQIYTNVSRILIAVNPFEGLPLYSCEVLNKYSSAAQASDLPPHIYGVGQDALQGLRTGAKDQAILISGESGAGKTESAKLVLSFVAEALRGKHGGIEENLLRTNPILEAFGNAMTVRNNNSSRFGKWLDINFQTLQMTGCSLTSYLLEVTRVTSQAPLERGYHVFFQLIGQRKSTKLDIASMKLDESTKYRYLKGGKQSVMTIDDNKCFLDVTEGFTALKFDPELQKEIFRILGAILVFGNCEFKADDEEAKLQNPAVVQHAAELFKVPSERLSKVMTHKKIMVGKDSMEKPVRGDQASNLRDSISRLVYGRLFLWLIERINSTLILEGAGGGGAVDAPRSLGILDIAGFETFEINSLEQLLINLSNEHLQQQFNNQVFKTELEDYKKEGVDMQDIKFTDNADVLALLDSKGSILDMLDEAVSLPKCTDLTYTDNVLKTHAKHPRIAKPKFPGKAVFGVKHYAGEVMYTIDGFIEKNADKAPDELPDLLKESEMMILKELGQALSEAAGGAPTPGAKKKVKTAASGFRAGLKALMAKINAADPHYIRCIKPNAEKVPSKVDDKMVYQQLLFSGVFDAIKIRQMGFSSRMPFKEFVSRYMAVVDPAVRKTLRPSSPNAEIKKEDVQNLIKNLQLGDDQYRVGSTKVLLKQIALNSLELARTIKLEKPATLIQSAWRRKKARKGIAEKKNVQAELREWLKASSVFDSQQAGGTGKQRKRLTVKLTATSAIKKLGSPEAVEAAMGKVMPLLDRAKACGLHTPVVFEATKTHGRMKLEMECVADVKGLFTSTDPVVMDKALIRSRELGLPEDATTKQLQGRMEKLQIQLPLVTAMRGVIETEGADESQLVAVMEGLENSGFKDKPDDWLPELDAVTLLDQMKELWAARPHLHGKKASMAVPGARKTITGCGPAEQAKLLHNLSEAAEKYDVDELENLLKAALLQGISAWDLEASKKVYEQLNTEAFLSELVPSVVVKADDPSAPKVVFAQLQNLAKQVRKLQGDTELYAMASRAAQKSGRKTLAGMNASGLVDSIFSDLSSYEGLKPSTVANKETSLTYSMQCITEALTLVPDNLEARAVQCFRNIMIGMYDKPASDVEVMSSRQAVMECACSEDTHGLRNEIYVQAMKQIKDNPNERSQLMGWQLLRFLCQASPPRPDLMEFVEAFASEALASGVTGVPDLQFLKAAGIAEEDWHAYTVDVSREASDCLAALQRPQSWCLASAPGESTVALVAKPSEHNNYGNQQYANQGHMQPMDIENPGYHQQMGQPQPVVREGGSCADKCSKCTLL